MEKVTFNAADLDRVKRTPMTGLCLRYDEGNVPGIGDKLQLWSCDDPERGFLVAIIPLDTIQTET